MLRPAAARQSVWEIVVLLPALVQVGARHAAIGLNPLEPLPVFVKSSGACMRWNVVHRRQGCLVKKRGRKVSLCVDDSECKPVFCILVVGHTRLLAALLAPRWAADCCSIPAANIAFDTPDRFAVFPFTTSLISSRGLLLVRACCVSRACNRGVCSLGTRTAKLANLVIAGS